MLKQGECRIILRLTESDNYVYSIKNKWERSMENTNPEELSFEEALKALEEIVDRLSNNANNLDEMLKLYARGVEYLKRCQAKLGEAEARIKILGEELPGKIQEMSNGS